MAGRLQAFTGKPLVGWGTAQIWLDEYQYNLIIECGRPNESEPFTMHDGFKISEMDMYNEASLTLASFVFHFYYLRCFVHLICVCVSYGLDGSLVTLACW